MTTSRSLLAAVLTASIGLAACGASDSSTAPETVPTEQVDTSTDTASDSAEAAGISLVAPEQAAATIADPPEDLVILDVRTQEEFDEGHIDGAVMIDFYGEDFVDRLAALDPDVPYVLYCRSGNRSASAGSIMAELGFQSVDDVDGGIISWQATGLPVVTE